MENNVRQFREALMMTKAELARKAGISALTIDRIEAGRPCRLTTKRKILNALGLGLEDRNRVFGTKSASSAPPSEGTEVEAPMPWKTGGGLQ